MSQGFVGGAASITLQEAYNNGQTITASSGAVIFTAPNGSNIPALTIVQSDTINNPVAFTLTNSGTGNDISATNWSVSKAGLVTGSFSGALTGNVTGNCSGSSGSCTGNAATVSNATFTTALTVNGGTLTLTANVANNSVLTIGAGAVSVSGSNTGDQTNISGNAATVTVANEGADTTCFPLFGVSATGSLEPKTNAGLTFDSSTGTLSSTAFSSGAITGTSFVIGGNTLNTAEWANLDGINQTVATTSSPTFANVTIGDSGTVNYDAVPAADVSASGEATTLTVDAGTGSTAVGQAYKVDTDGELIDADADAASTMPCMCLALETGTGSKKVLLRGFIRNDAWNWTVGGIIYVSTDPTTTTGLTQTAPSGTGDQVQAVGVATHADRMYFDPSLVLVEIL